MNIFVKRAAAGATAIALGLGLVAVSGTAANAVTSTYSFKIDTLTEANGVGFDTNATAGDDDGFLALTSDVVLLEGGNDIYGYNLSTLVDVAASDAKVDGREELYTDLATETAYILTAPIGGDDDFFGQAQALDASGNLTDTIIEFSEPIPYGATDPDGNDYEWISASGAGQLAFWNASTGDFYVVSLPSGTVTKSTVVTIDDFTGVAPDVSNDESDTDIDYNGVLEFDCTAYSIVMLDTDTNFSRFNLATGVQETILDNSSTYDYFDNDNLVVSPTGNRWYAHGENDGENDQFGVDVSGMDEELISADATSTLTAGVCSDPELPNTGIDAAQSGLLAAAAGVLGLVGVAFIVVRRRANA